TGGSKTRIIHASALMAISTPAQHPRGAARRTFSTFTVDEPSGCAPSEVRLLGSAPYPVRMSPPTVVAVAPASPGARAGLQPGEEILSIDGERPCDVIQWRLLTDEPDLSLEVRRGGVDFELGVPQAAGEPVGAAVRWAL